MSRGVYPQRATVIKQIAQSGTQHEPRQKRKDLAVEQREYRCRKPYCSVGIGQHTAEEPLQSASEHHLFTHRRHKGKDKQIDYQRTDIRPAKIHFKLGLGGFSHRTHLLLKRGEALRQMPRVVQTGKPVRHRQEAYENQASSNDFASHTLYHGHTQMAQRIAIKQICEKQRSSPANETSCVTTSVTIFKPTPPDTKPVTTEKPVDNIKKRTKISPNANNCPPGFVFSKNCFIVTFVTPAGFKPTTFGTGIRRSIQLNYGAIASKKHTFNGCGGKLFCYG